MDVYNEHVLLTQYHHGVPLSSSYGTITGGNGVSHSLPSSSLHVVSHNNNQATPLIVANQWTPTTSSWNFQHPSYHPIQQQQHSHSSINNTMGAPVFGEGNANTEQQSSDEFASNNNLATAPSTSSSSSHATSDPFTSSYHHNHTNDMHQVVVPSYQFGQSGGNAVAAGMGMASHIFGDNNNMQHSLTSNGINGHMQHNAPQAALALSPSHTLESDDALVSPPHHMHNHHNGHHGGHQHHNMNGNMVMGGSSVPTGVWATPANGGTVMGHLGMSHGHHGHQGHGNNSRDHMASSPIPSQDPLSSESDSPAIGMRSIRSNVLASSVASTSALPTPFSLPPLSLPPALQRMRFDRDPTMSVTGSSDFLPTPLDRCDTFSLSDEPSSPASSSSSEGTNGSGNGASSTSTCVCCHQSIERSSMQQHVARCFVQRHMQHMRTCPASPRNTPMAVGGAAMSPFQSPMSSPSPSGISVMIPPRGSPSSSPSPRASPRQSPRSSPRASPLSSPRSLSSSSASLAASPSSNVGGHHSHHHTSQQQGSSQQHAHAISSSRSSPPLSPCSSSCQVPTNEAPGATIYRLRSLLSRMDIHRRISLMEAFNRLSHQSSVGSSSPIRGGSSGVGVTASSMSPKASLEDEEALTLLFHTPPSGPRTPVLSPPPLGSPLLGGVPPQSPLGKRTRAPTDMDHPMATAAKHRHYLPTLSL
jgi:hypothetical protein